MRGMEFWDFYLMHWGISIFWPTWDSCPFFIHYAKPTLLKVLVSSLLSRKEYVNCINTFRKVYKHWDGLAHLIGYLYHRKLKVPKTPHPRISHRVCRANSPFLWYNNLIQRAFIDAISCSFLVSVICNFSRPWNQVSCSSMPVFFPSPTLCRP